MSEAATSSKADDAKKAEKTREDNATLAFMLRESADIVEKGGFDVILYHALQDFRTYYKFHLPKHKAKAKKKPATPATASSTTIPAAGSVEKSAPSATSEAAASTSLDAQKEASSKPAETTSVPSESTSVEPAAAAETSADAKTVDPPSQSTPEEEKSGNAPASAKREVSAESAAISEGTASTTFSTTIPSGNPADPPTSARGLQMDATESAAEAEASDEPMDAEAARIDSILDSGRCVEELFNNESSGRGDHDKSRQKFASPLGKKVGAATKGAASKLSAGMFATGGKIGKKLTKIHLPSSGKKKREAELKDLTGGDVAQYAESSRRRAAAGDEDQQQYYHQNDDTNLQSPPRSSTNLQPAVTGLGTTEPPSSTATTTREATVTPVDRVRENDSEQSEKPSSLREIENIYNAAANRHNNEEPPPVAPTAPTSLVPSFASTSASSEASVSDPRPKSFEFDMPEHGHSKSAFQRPKNKNSAVVASGWVEQQRRSKMRTVWKEVLASLVQGRHPGEETTLWIQREIINPTTDKKELEALHQIPVKFMEGVVYSEYTTDDRFSLKLYSSPEEFVFRCNQDPSAAMNWVTILQQYEMETKKNGTNVGASAPPESAFPDLPEEKKGADTNGRARSPPPTRLAIRDLRAICHGAGINTAGMERTDLERAAAEVEQRGTYFAPPTASYAAVASVPAAGGGGGSNAPSRSASPVPPPTAAEPSAPPANTAIKMSIKDLRAICHGDGISTVGMERGELERAAAEVQQRGTYFAPPAAVPPVDDAAKQEQIRRRQAAEDEARRRASEEEHWRRHEEESHRRAAGEEHRRREEEHRRLAEEEHRRRAAEEEHRRQMAEQQADEQRRRYAKQQAAWHHQQQQEEQRRRMTEQQAAEQRRRHEEAMRNQQQWAGQQAQQPQQQQQQHQSWSQHPPQQPNPRHQQQQQYQQPNAQQWQQQQQQQWRQEQQRRSQAPPPQQHYQQQQQQHAPPPQQQSKYAKMANQSDDDGQAAIIKLKHDILIQWALHPPQMQMLRSVDVLLCTIQNVFPPALGVPAHDYFKKWKVFTRESVLSDAGIIDEEKVKKAVRKLRFFLHPDKLPKDLNSEQQFMVKMLWDITNDAMEEYQKSKEDLDWVK